MYNYCIMCTQNPYFGFQVLSSDLGFRVQGSGFRVQVSGFGVNCLGFENILPYNVFTSVSSVWVRRTPPPCNSGIIRI